MFLCHFKIYFEKPFTFRFSFIFIYFLIIKLLCCYRFFLCLYIYCKGAFNLMQCFLLQCNLFLFIFISVYKHYYYFYYYYYHISITIIKYIIHQFSSLLIPSNFLPLQLFLFKFFIDFKFGIHFAILFFVISLLSIICFLRFFVCHFPFTVNFWLSKLTVTTGE